MDPRETASFMFAVPAPGVQARAGAWSVCRRRFLAAARFAFHLIAGPF
jgi:hypothetical protein